MVEEITPNNNYTIMQKNLYESLASQWNVNNLDPVVGTFNEHNAWVDYEYLFVDIPEKYKKDVLDFGCGPGRNLVKYSDQFNRIDGVDIAQRNLQNASIWIRYNQKDEAKHKLILCNGVDISNIGNEEYDIVMSTISMQHICVYKIRLNYLREFYRVLKPGGYITLQMGYGGSGTGVDYYYNSYEAIASNGGCDTNITDILQIQKDLEGIGFKNFKYYIRPVGPGDRHANWIFFNAQK